MSERDYTKELTLVLEWMADQYGELMFPVLANALDSDNPATREGAIVGVGIVLSRLIDKLHAMRQLGEEAI